MRNLIKKIYQKFSVNYRKQTQILNILGDMKKELQHNNNTAVESLQRQADELNKLADDLSLKLNVINQTVNMNSVKVSGLKKKVPQKVLFLVHNAEVWTSLHGVWQAMNSDPGFKVVVASCNRRYPSSYKLRGEDIVHGMLQKLHIPHIRLVDEDSYRDLNIIKRFRPDIIFRQSKWDTDVPPAFSVPNLRFAKLYSVAYAIAPMTEHSFANGGDMDIFRRNCDAMFVLNTEVAKIYVAVDQSGVNIVPTGHPRVDEILSTAPSWPIKTANKFRVMWSTHHSIFNEWNNFSVFLSIYRVMLSIAKKHPEIDFLFSPHPGLWGSLERVERDMPLEYKRIKIFLKSWDSLPNTEIIPNGEYIAPMKASDLLIVDGVSLLLEYQLTKKPIILFEHPGHVKFNEIGVMMRNAANIVNYNNTDDIEKAILYFKNGGKNSKQLEELKNYKFLTKSVNAAQNIVNYIKSDKEHEK